MLVLAGDLSQVDLRSREGLEHKALASICEIIKFCGQATAGPAPNQSNVEDCKRMVEFLESLAACFKYSKRAVLGVNRERHCQGRQSPEVTDAKRGHSSQMCRGQDPQGCLPSDVIALGKGDHL